MPDKTYEEMSRDELISALHEASLNYETLKRISERRFSFLSQMHMQHCRWNPAQWVLFRFLYRSPALRHRILSEGATANFEAATKHYDDAVAAAEDQKS